jgi:hypothetical protein
MDNFPYRKDKKIHLISSIQYNCFGAQIRTFMCLTCSFCWQPPLAVKDILLNKILETNSKQGSPKYLKFFSKEHNWSMNSIHLNH